MSARQAAPPIAPHPGYLLAIPYVPDTTTFKSVREETGEDQKSRVLAVGDSVVDSNGQIRQAGVKIGDVIIHAASNKTFELDFTQYRFVHFTEIHGVWKEGRESK